MKTQKSGQVIIALDFPDAASCQAFLTPFGPETYVKVGMELFYKEGPDLIRQLKDRGYRIFLDLKLHDIPNTVRAGMRSLASLGVDMVNLHAAGGRVMMEAAKEGLEEGWEAAGRPGPHPLLLAVTQLTSISQEVMNQELGIPGPLENTVIRYGSLAQAAGLDGVVCSPLESPLIHEQVGPDFLTVTPGIRWASGSADDQQRITTPGKAHGLGSDFIVVGRAITKAPDPLAAYQAVQKAFESGIDPAQGA